MPFPPRWMQVLVGIFSQEQQHFQNYWYTLAGPTVSTWPDNSMRVALRAYLDEAYRHVGMFEAFNSEPTLTVHVWVGEVGFAARFDDASYFSSAVPVFRHPAAGGAAVLIRKLDDSGRKRGHLLKGRVNQGDLEGNHVTGIGQVKHLNFGAGLLIPWGWGGRTLTWAVPQYRVPALVPIASVEVDQLVRWRHRWSVSRLHPATWSTPLTLP